MTTFFAAPFNLSGISIDGLFVCRQCAGVYGDLAWRFRGRLHAGPRQHCDCQTPATSGPWPHFDFPEAVTWCRCCGRRALPSGSRWSLWFCEFCLPGVKAVNRLCNATVIPTCRHSLLEHLYSLLDEIAEPPLSVRAIGDWFTRADLLDSHARKIVLNHLDQLYLSNWINDFTLEEYLRKTTSSVGSQDNALLDLGRAFRLPPNLVRDALRRV